MKELRDKVSGLCLPTYVLDLPSGAGKVPIEESYIKNLTGEEYQLTDTKGRRHSYE